MKRPYVPLLVLMLVLFAPLVPPASAGGSTAGIYETNVRDKYLIAGQADQLILSFTVKPWSADVMVNSLDLTCAPSNGLTNISLMQGNTVLGQTTFTPSDLTGNQTAHFGASSFVLPGGEATELRLLATVAKNTGDFITACAIDDLFLQVISSGWVFSSEAQAIGFNGINRLIYIDDLSTDDINADFTVFDATVWPSSLPLNSKDNLIMDVNINASKDILIKDLFIYCDNGSIFQKYRLEANGVSVLPDAVQNNWVTNSRPEHSSADRIVFSNMNTVTGYGEGVNIKLYGDTYNYFSYYADRKTVCSVIDLNSSVFGSTLESVTAYEKSLVTSPSTTLTDRLRGTILLQVESAGQAWYVDPVSEKKYYLPDGAVAYSALRNFGLGITNADLAKIPVGIEERFKDIDTDGDGLADKLEEGLKTNPTKSDTDGDGTSDGMEIVNGTNPLGAGLLSRDSSMVSRVTGRILIQVESRGEAWYVNPRDGKRYYMTNGDAAYQIMRYLSLGITNEDIRKIEVGLIE